MEMRENQDRAKRLLAYSAAAGLGAFAFGQQANAAIVHVDIPDVTLDVRATGPGYEIYLDIDGDTDTDFKIQFVDFGSQYAAVRGRSMDYNLSMTNKAKGNDYYIRSFDTGNIIGFGNPNAAVCTGAGEIIKPTGAGAAGFGRDVDSYMGFALHEDGSSDFYFGWIRLQTDWNPDPAPYGVADGVTVFEFAYETEANTDIVAGAVPEPATLGMLAAGLGGLAVRRRKA